MNSMRRRLLAIVSLVCFDGLVWTSLSLAETPSTDPPQTYQSVVAPFFQRYCVDCHGPDAQDAQLSLHDIDPDPARGQHLEQWQAIKEQLKLGIMPPDDMPKPSEAERGRVVAWVQQLKSRVVEQGDVSAKLLLPEYGNYLDHDLLFSGTAGPVTPPPPRIWRLSPSHYMGWVGDVARGQTGGVNPPFSVRGGTAFQDYAAPYTIDEPTTQMLLRNAMAIVDRQTKRVLDSRTGKLRRINDTVREFFDVLDEANKPTEKQVAKAIRLQFHAAVQRPPTNDELARYSDLFERNVAIGGQEKGAKITLATVLLHPEAVFRFELGDGPVDEFGRRRLSQTEIAAAVSFALGFHRERGIYEAAAKGELQTREQVASHVERMLNTEKVDRARLLLFFREYFGYHRATDVFKDDLKDVKFDARVLVSDADMLVEHILKQDRHVLRELLTTRRAFVNIKVNRQRNTVEKAVTVGRPNNKRDKPKLEFHTLYGLDNDWEWTAKQPVMLPNEKRMGLLTHPAWLVAWSGNFDNDPVRRGRWIREHLLGGVLPDVPIGVDARIPDAADQTLRERLTVTRAAECWRCHRKMDPLGLPFEQFDHYGRFRLTELDQPVDTSGEILRSGVGGLDAGVETPFDLIERCRRR